MAEKKLEVVDTYFAPEGHKLLIHFQQSDENSAFLSVRCDRIEMYEDHVEVYDRDFDNPICTVHEYGFWFADDAVVIEREKGKSS